MTMLPHKGEYSLLALLIGFYLAVVIRYQGVPQYLLWATAAFSFLYLIWGIFHHLRNHSVTGKVVLEYLLVSLLAMSLISTLLV